MTLVLNWLARLPISITNCSSVSVLLRFTLPKNYTDALAIFDKQQRNLIKDILIAVFNPLCSKIEKTPVTESGDSDSCYVVERILIKLFTAAIEDLLPQYLAHQICNQNSSL